MVPPMVSLHIRLLSHHGPATWCFHMVVDRIRCSFRGRDVEKGSLRNTSLIILDLAILA